MKACSGALDLGTGRTSRWGIQSKPNAIRCQAEHYSVVPNGIPRLKANTFPGGMLPKDEASGAATLDNNRTLKAPLTNEGASSEIVQAGDQ